MCRQASVARGTPFNKFSYKNKWYTNVTLGRDSGNHVVTMHAHVLICAATHGVPNTVLHPPTGKKAKSKIHQALHLPPCPSVHGGCNNPLHLRWGLPVDNLHDQGFRMQGKRKGRPRVSLPTIQEARARTRSQAQV